MAILKPTPADGVDTFTSQHKTMSYTVIEPALIVLNSKIIFTFACDPFAKHSFRERDV